MSSSAISYVVVVDDTKAKQWEHTFDPKSITSINNHFRTLHNTIPFVTVQVLHFVAIMVYRFLLLVPLLSLADGFQSPKLPIHTIARPTTPAFHSSPLFNKKHDKNEMGKESLDVNGSEGVANVKKPSIISKIHGPITYLSLGLLAGLRWKWCFRNPYYWFAMAFCVKWFRARYIFKIPVWDRQPNWNNIITSKEQEKDLKAFTCKNCGSTLFIAKTREFFFEGSTGIGGLGCFTCGAKGADNFVMDRDRIVEDVADMDDYFEYERPLDFVSAAERRKLLKEAGGDESKANEILLERETAPTADSEEVIVDAEIEENGVEENGAQESTIENAAQESTIENAAIEPTSDKKPEGEEIVADEKSEPVAESKPKKEKEEKKSGTSPKKDAKQSNAEKTNKPSASKEQPPQEDDDFDLDDLGMDDF
eukprot:scaffold24664_cov230-Cylindrotheca_fusiformis.AAC.1